ncbi:hypothetical protein IQ06DRAFT_292957 [Phaeosphaeriaceae sp. SRC1lsM3a]|nr:hypothetical protein IQ06DRAFT_292957 [Stagonospora sp. SRC1lsM3a]
MKSSTIIASAAALFGTALAAPHLAARQTPTTDLFFVIQVTSDVSGASVNAAVPVNAPQASTFGGLLAGTYFSKNNNGRIKASSLLAVTPGVGGNAVQCTFNNALTLNSTVTFIDLDGNPATAIDVDITDATIECEL